MSYLWVPLFLVTLEQRSHCQTWKSFFFLFLFLFFLHFAFCYLFLFVLLNLGRFWVYLILPQACLEPRILPQHPKCWDYRTEAPDKPLFLYHVQTLILDFMQAREPEKSPLFSFSLAHLQSASLVELCCRTVSYQLSESCFTRDGQWHISDTFYNQCSTCTERCMAMLWLQQIVPHCISLAFRRFALQ